MSSRKIVAGLKAAIKYAKTDKGAKVTRYVVRPKRAPKRKLLKFPCWAIDERSGGPSFVRPDRATAVRCVKFWKLRRARIVKGTFVEDRK